MIARAPGKVVITGAYAVLEGAPALVAAIDRYVEADASEWAARVTPEVACALGPGHVAPWFDASALRRDDRKLGLGSSAAILVASLAALDVARQGDVDDATLCSRVLAPALVAHREAQRGGSGIDVAASCHGGVLCCRRRFGGVLEIDSHRLPDGLVIEVWASPHEASTPELLAKVHRLREDNPHAYERALSALGAASEAALAADGAAAFKDACVRVMEGLDELGRESRAPIVTSDVRAFDEAARTAGAVVVPSGAGGGDVVLHVADGPSTASTREAALRAGLVPLDVRLGARGVHAALRRRGVE
jgi:phosphomevalonate kinase